MSDHHHLQAANIFKCEGLTAVVTGGGTGIGLMQTLTLAQNGAKVFITSRNEEKLQDVAKKYGQNGNIVPVAGDISTKDGISKIVQQVGKGASGGINILFNNAGVAGEGSREGYGQSDDAEKYSQQLLKSEFSEWDHILKTNVTSHYFVAASFLPLLKKGAESVKGYTSQIINVTSISGLMKGASGGQFAYAASKESMVQASPLMTKVMAREFLPLKIRVNQIAPGIFPSEMTAGDSDNNTHKSDLSGSEMGKGLPAGRPGKEEDMAAATLYLASYGGVFSNGQALWPDGGATVATPSSI